MPNILLATEPNNNSILGKLTIVLKIVLGYLIVKYLDGFRLFSALSNPSNAEPIDNGGAPFVLYIILTFFRLNNFEIIFAI